MKKNSKQQLEEKIQEISKKIEEIKITGFHILSTDLYKIGNDTLIREISKKFENHPATILILRNTADNKLYSKQTPIWELPSQLKSLEDEILKKNDYYLDLFFYKLETQKNNFILKGTSKNPSFSSNLITQTLINQHLDFQKFSF